MKRLSCPKNPVEKHSSTVQMFLTTTIMKITIERFILIVIVFAAVINARVSKNTKVRNSKKNNHTIIDAFKNPTPTKRDIENLEEVVTINEPVIYNNNISGLNNNKPIDLTELLQEKLKALIGKDDATKLEFLKNIKDVLGVNSYENNEDDALEALRRGENTEYEMEISMGRRSIDIGNLATTGFTGHGLPASLPLLPAHVYRPALRSLLNQRRFNRLFVNNPNVHPTLLLEVLRTPPRQANLLVPREKIQATQENQPNVQQLQATQPLQAMLSLPLQNMETETVFLMNHQEIQKPVFDSNDNAYPYEPFIKN